MGECQGGRVILEADERGIRLQYGLADEGRAGSAHTEDMKEWAEALHTLCQPLTALHCRLEIGAMTDTLPGYRDLVKEGLAECDRMMRTIGTMRGCISAGLERARDA